VPDERQERTRQQRTETLDTVRRATIASFSAQIIRYMPLLSGIAIWLSLLFYNVFYMGPLFGGTSPKELRAIPSMQASIASMAEAQAKILHLLQNAQGTHSAASRTADECKEAIGQLAEIVPLLEANIVGVCDRRQPTKSVDEWVMDFPDLAEARAAYQARLREARRQRDEEDE